jgi:hypothetical protein
MVVDGAASIMMAGGYAAAFCCRARFPFQGSSSDLLGRMILQSCEDIGEPGLRIDVVELGGLCRPPNYAERARFPHDSLRPAVIGAA